MLDVEVDGQKVMLVNCLGGKLRAYQDRCPSTIHTFPMCTYQYQAYELTELNSSFPQFFDNTFIEGGFLWSNQNLNNFNCNKAEVTCAIPVFPVLEIGSLELAKIIAEISKEYYGIEYFLASSLTCDVKGYKDSESIYVYRHKILPHSYPVDFNPNFYDTINNNRLTPP